MFEEIVKNISDRIQEHNLSCDASYTAAAMISALNRRNIPYVLHDGYMVISQIHGGFVVNRTMTRYVWVTVEDKIADPRMMAILARFPHLRENTYAYTVERPLGLDLYGEGMNELKDLDDAITLLKDSVRLFWIRMPNPDNLREKLTM